MKYPLEQELAKYHKKQFHLKQALKREEKKLRKQKKEIIQKLDKKIGITVSEFDFYNKDVSRLNKLRSKVSKNLGKIKALEEKIKKVKKDLTK